jgi:hypothetical protein
MNISRPMDARIFKMRERTAIDLMFAGTSLSGKYRCRIKMLRNPFKVIAASPKRMRKIIRRSSVLVSLALMSCMTSKIKQINAGMDNVKFRPKNIFHLVGIIAGQVLSVIPLVAFHRL